MIFFFDNYSIKFEGIPNLNETSQEAVLIFAGEEAYIDCKVENLQNYTVLFKFINPEHNSEKSDIISAGNVMITSDERFSILHHSGIQTLYLFYYTFLN